MNTYHFSLLLVFATLVTGLIWLLDHKLWKPKRAEKISAAEQQAGTELSSEQAQRVAPQSSLAEFSQSAFPILLGILILRSFIYEPFRIPSGSMMPTLLQGDFILVEKFRYGLREPITRTEFIRTGRPDRGDIAVFKFPLEPDIDYIKRVVGLPGDRVVYEDKTFYIQSDCVPDCRGVEPQVLAQDKLGSGTYHRDRHPLDEYRETAGEHSYRILQDPSVAPRLGNYMSQNDTEPNEWLVPENHYFMVGDNRDNSIDGRYWGFVHEDDLVGRAVFIWISFEFERSADSWLPGWLPSGVRFNRLGGIE